MDITRNDQTQHERKVDDNKFKGNGAFPIAKVDPETKELRYHSTRSVDQGGSDFAKRLGSALDALRDDDQETKQATQPKPVHEKPHGSVEHRTDVEPDDAPETVTPTEMKDKPSDSFIDAVLDSKVTDGLIFAGLIGLAVLAAPVSGALALGAAAAAISVAADVITHRMRGDEKGFLRRGGSIIKALTAGAAVALLPVTSLGGAIAACASVWLSEAIIADEPDDEGSLMKGDVIPRLAKWSGVDGSKVAEVLKRVSSVLPILPLVLIGVVVMVFGRRKLLESNVKKTSIASRVARPVRAVTKGAVTGWAANGLTALSSSLV